jgi:hypothetical protein
MGPLQDRIRELESQVSDLQGQLDDARAAVAAEPEPEPESDPGSASSFGDGTYLVGEDIKPGTYRAPGSNAGCYWERLRNLKGGMNSIIANDLTSKKSPQLVTIAPSDMAFNTEDCGTWERL